MTKRIGDILSIGLIGISIWVITGIKWVGIVGASITVAVELYYLYKSWLK